MHTYILWT